MNESIWTQKVSKEARSHGLLDIFLAALFLCALLKIYTFALMKNLLLQDKVWFSAILAIGAKIRSKPPF